MVRLARCALRRVVRQRWWRLGVAGDLGDVVASAVAAPWSGSGGLALAATAFPSWVVSSTLVLRVAPVRIRAKAPRSSAGDDNACGYRFPLRDVVVGPLTVRGLRDENSSSTSRA